MTPRVLYNTTQDTVWYVPAVYLCGTLPVTGHYGRHLLLSLQFRSFLIHSFKEEILDLSTMQTRLRQKILCSRGRRFSRHETKSKLGPVPLYGIRGTLRIMAEAALSSFSVTSQIFFTHSPLPFQPAGLVALLYV